MYLLRYKTTQNRQRHNNKPMYTAMVRQRYAAACHLRMQKPDDKKRHSNHHAQQTQNLHYHDNIRINLLVILAKQHRQRHAAGKHSHNAAFKIFPRQLCRNNGQYHTCSQNNYRCFCYTYQLSQKVIPGVRGKGRANTITCNH